MSSINDENFDQEKAIGHSQKCDYMSAYVVNTAKILKQRVKKKFSLSQKFFFLIFFIFFFLIPVKTFK